MSHPTHPNLPILAITTCYALVVLTLIGLTAQLGCDKGTPEPAPTTSNSEEKKDETTSVQPSQSLSPSPTKLVAADDQNNKLKAGFDQTPRGTCEAFMTLLQDGNRIAAENLLTRTSIANITKAGLILEPMGGPQSTCKIGQIQYATTKQELAHVPCQITELVDGKTETMSVSWQVRKYGKAWRIAGVILETEAGKAPDLLSFENYVDVAKLQSMAGTDVINEAEALEAKSETPQDQTLRR